MRRVRVTLHPTDATVHPLYDFTAKCDEIETTELIHWNVTDREKPTIVFYHEGGRETFKDEAGELDGVLQHEVTSASDVSEGRGYYAYVRMRSTQTMRRLWELATYGGIVLVPPLEQKGGALKVTFVGEDGELREVLNRLPAGIQAEIDKVETAGSDATTAYRLNGAPNLSERQEEALTVAFETGYYDVPKRTTHEEIADRMGCSPSTASEHIKRAEAKLVETYLN